MKPRSNVKKLVTFTYSKDSKKMRNRKSRLIYNRLLLILIRYWRGSAPKIKF